MKLMFISDIHGSLHWLEQALAKAEEEQPHTLVILGDFCTMVRVIRFLRDMTRRRLPPG